MTRDAKGFYVTTPIYYINDVPHLGHAYTTVVCDAISRWQRMRGRDVRFLTGTDEHGEKAARSAEAQGITPQQLADRNVVRFREAWHRLGVAGDDFIRTTEPRHLKAAQELWRRIGHGGDIYKATYSGPYCVGCEAYHAESALVDGRCPEDPDHVVDVLSEESYFFRLSRYQEHLLDFYRRCPDFVLPKSRMNEVVSFVEMGLEDTSVSRTRISWGVPVPGDPAHVMYVWIEALANYLTGLGFGSEDASRFERFWPADLHVVGKDILRFHAVFWPAFLMAAGIEPPRHVLAHGWWLKDDQKMSKTRGNVADPIQLVEWFGSDPVRWFLLREISLGADGNYSEEALVDRVNNDLANDLGNTLSRVTRIVSRDLDGRVPRRREPRHLSEVAQEAWTACRDAWDAHAPQAALKAAWRLLDATNKEIVDTEPWKLVKEEGSRERLEEVMHDAAEALRHVAVMIAPAVPKGAAEVLKRLGLVADPFAGLLLDDEDRIQWGFPEQDHDVEHGSALFPRIDKAAFFADTRRDDEGRTTSEREAEKHARSVAKAGTAAAGAGHAGRPGEIEFGDFAKVDLMAARVRSCKRHPNADKLLVLELDDGDDEPRTVCAGVAPWYAPEELEGKTIVIVGNLAPRKLRGVMSQGMLLAANFEEGGEERVRVVVLDGDVPPGAEIR